VSIAASASERGAERIDGSAEQGGQRDGDLDVGSGAVAAGDEWVVQGGQADFDEGVGAALVGAAQILRTGFSGPGSDRGHHGGGAVGGQQRPDFGHPVVAGAVGDPPLLEAGAVFVFFAAVLESFDGAAHGLPELSGGLSGRCGQHFRLYCPGQVGVGGVEVFDQGTGLDRGDRALLECVQGFGQRPR
jgi:hypothetical protein